MMNQRERNLYTADNLDKLATYIERHVKQRQLISNYFRADASNNKVSFRSLHDCGDYGDALGWCPFHPDMPALKSMFENGALCREKYLKHYFPLLYDYFYLHHKSFGKGRSSEKRAVVGRLRKVAAQLRITPMGITRTENLNYFLERAMTATHQEHWFYLAETEQGARHLFESFLRMLNLGEKVKYTFKSITKVIDVGKVKIYFKSIGSMDPQSVRGYELDGVIVDGEYRADLIFYENPELFNELSLRLKNRREKKR